MLQNVTCIQAFASKDLISYQFGINNSSGSDLRIEKTGFPYEFEVVPTRRQYGSEDAVTELMNVTRRISEGRRYAGHRVDSG